MKRVLVAGEINPDLVLGGCAQLPRADRETVARARARVPGSSAMIMAMGLARLGQSVSFIGCAGHDADGDFCVDSLRTSGVDTTAILRSDAWETGLTVSVSTADDRALITFPGAMGELTLAMVDAAGWQGAAHLHVSSMYLQTALRPELATLFAKAKAAGLSTSLDPGFDPAETWGDVAAWREMLAYVDVFMPSRRELRAISRIDDVHKAGDRVAAPGMTLVVKCAADGALLRTPRGQWLGAKTRRPEDFVDATGAGDSFDAGFLHAWLAAAPWADCLAFGNGCGSLSTRGFGGTAAQPDEGHLKAWLEMKA